MGGGARSGTTAFQRRQGVRGPAPWLARFPARCIGCNNTQPPRRLVARCCCRCPGRGEGCCSNLARKVNSQNKTPDRIQNRRVHDNWVRILRGGWRRARTCMLGADGEYPHPVIADRQPSFSPADACEPGMRGPSDAASANLKRAHPHREQAGVRHAKIKRGHQRPGGRRHLAAWPERNRRRCSVESIRSCLSTSSAKGKIHTLHPPPPHTQPPPATGQAPAGPRRRATR